MPAATRRAFLCDALCAIPALALAACTLPGQRPAPPPLDAPTPTPRPTPTPAPSRAVVALPRPPSVVARRSATPTPDPTLSRTGTLLYVSRAPGEQGIVLARGDGPRRLLLPGEYGLAIWSPDGWRFAATTPFDSPATRVDLFDPTGRVLQQVALEGKLMQPPKWTRAGGHVLVSVSGASSVAAGGWAIRHWIIGEGEGRSSGRDGVAELRLGDDRYLRPGEWSATGRLAVSVVFASASGGPAWHSGTAELWTTGVTLTATRRLAIGRYDPVGWSPDGLTLYARGEYVPVYEPDGTQYDAATALFAIDEQDGLIRRVVGLTEIAAQLAELGAAPPRPLRAIWLAAPAPTGGRIAIWCSLARDSATTPNAPMTFTLTIVDDAGRVVWWERQTQPPVHFISPAWSPTGKHLAYGYSDKGSATATRVIAIGDDTEFTVPLAALDPPQWSADGWGLALGTRRGLELVGVDPPGKATLVDAHGRSPSWRPRH